jgi:hypothetical protein
MAPGFAGLGWRRSRKSEAGRRRARLADRRRLRSTLPAWGGAASRISEFVDNLLLKAEERSIIAGMKNPTAASPATGHWTSAKLRQRFAAHGVLQPERVGAIGDEIFDSNRP